MISVNILKYFFLGLIFAFFACSEKSNVANNQNKLTESFDQILADSLGADDFGMRINYFAYLKAGPNRSHGNEEAQAIQKAHLENIVRMSQEGKLVVAGPFMDETEIRGIYIFATSTMEEAEELVNTDPAVKAGRLSMELHPWYGPASLMTTAAVSKQITKKSIF